MTADPREREELHSFTMAPPSSSAAQPASMRSNRLPLVVVQHRSITVSSPNQPGACAGQASMRAWVEMERQARAARLTREHRRPAAINRSPYTWPICACPLGSVRMRLESTTRSRSNHAGAKAAAALRTTQSFFEFAAAARGTRTRILSLHPNGNQAIRFCWEDLRRGRTWEEAQELDQRIQSSARERT